MMKTILMETRGAGRRLAMVLLCFAVVMVSTAFAAEPSSFARGNEYFKSGDYAKAAAAYEKELADHGPDAAVFYNLGNSYQQQKKYGPAILAYERAKVLTPRDPDLMANLARARKAATAFEESPENPRVWQVTHFLSLNEWSWLVAGAALALGGLAIGFGAVGARQRWARRCGIAIAALAVVFIVAGAAAILQRRGELARGVILTEGTAVRLSPFAAADPLGTAAPGRMVELGAKTGGFRYVEVPGGGLSGWVADGDVAAVFPGK